MANTAKRDKKDLATDLRELMADRTAELTRKGNVREAQRFISLPLIEVIEWLETDASS